MKVGELLDILQNMNRNSDIILTIERGRGLSICDEFEVDIELPEESLTDFGVIYLTGEETHSD